MVNQIICGDCREILKTLPDESVDLILTSPPYWYLRDYGEAAVQIWGGTPTCTHEFRKNNFCSKCGAWYGQFGHEPDWRLYIQHLTEMFAECKRVLKKHGNLVVNLGDTFAKSSGGPHGKNSQLAGRKVAGAQSFKRRKFINCTDPAGMKLGIPWRVRFALNDAGWISRDDIIWKKNNAMPSSVKSRFNTTYEMVFRFTKNTNPGRYCQVRTFAPPEIENEFRKRCANWGSVGVLPEGMCEESWKPYLVRLPAYLDLDAVREPHKESTIKRVLQTTLDRQGDGKSAKRVESMLVSWTRTDSSLRKAVRGRVIREKGKYGHVNISTTVDGLHDNRWSEYFHPYGSNPGDVWEIATTPNHEEHFAIFPEKLVAKLILALCPPDGVVLDPFCGSGTTLVVAERYGRKWLGIDAIPEFCEIARRQVEREARQFKIKFST